MSARPQQPSPAPAAGAAPAAGVPRATGTHPSLYEIFARIWLRELQRAAGRPLTLATVPDAALDQLAARGFDYVWLMGVWTLGVEGPRISREHVDLRADYDRMLPGWTPDDVVGSPYAVARYAVDPSLGGDAALALLRARLAQRGVGLLLDYVPNHVARDHHWITDRPEVFVREADGAVACGRDPYFPPWTDTAQLDFRLQATRDAGVETLLAIADRCDGVRCDMAMLLLEDVFRRTWSRSPRRADLEEGRGEYWAQVIDAVRRRRRDFLFLAEAYWDLEYRLQTLGFDYTYDKTFYDRLMHGSASAVRAHLGAGADYQRRSARFLENHDEPRVAEQLSPARRRAATVIAATVPGMRFFHEGQLEGRRIRTSVHLGRRVDEPVDEATVAFHDRLLYALRQAPLRRGSFTQLVPREAGPGNSTWDAFVAHRWDDPDGAALLIVNFSPGQAQCRLTVDLGGIGGREVVLCDLLSGQEYRRDGDALLDPARGLFVDLPGYSAHVFTVAR